MTGPTLLRSRDGFSTFNAARARKLQIPFQIVRCLAGLGGVKAFANEMVDVHLRVVLGRNRSTRPLRCSMRLGFQRIS